MIYKKKIIISMFFLLVIVGSISTRSPYRILEYEIPSITVSLIPSKNNEQSIPEEEYKLKSIHLRPWPYLTAYYNDAFFAKRALPKNFIQLRNSQDTIDGKELEKTIEIAVKEILNHKKNSELIHSIILKNSDFNYKYHSGLIVIKLKKYPFILKIYRETPFTFCHPFEKGLVPILFFRTGNGATRHLSGITRIPMKDITEKIIAKNESWKDRVTLPRKWLWLPEDEKWLIIKGEGSLSNFEVKIPSLYAIVCDEIQIEREFTFLHKEDRHTAIALSNLCNNQLDANIPNFVIEKNTGKIAIIDTEYFSLMLGLKKPLLPNSYLGWIKDLAYHSLKRMFFITKSEFLNECKATSSPYIDLYPTE